MFEIENTPFISWIIGIIVAVPLTTIVLGEIIDRLHRRENHYARFFEILRAIVLPVIIVFIIAKFLFNLDEVPRGVEGEKSLYLLFALILSTLYITIAYAAFVFLSTLKYESNPDAWENRIPGLFKAIFTIMIFIIPILLLLEAWGVQIGSFAKYASLAAAATAFALQDALSSITKGFLLVLDKPFAVGDWIEVNGVKGKVTDISWRSTRLRVGGNDIVVIPNLIISDNSVYNYTADDVSYRDMLILGFSYADPPNKVKQIMTELLFDCPDVMKVPPPRIYTVSYDDFSIAYRLYFYVEAYISNIDQERIRDDIMSRVWYAADRGGLSIPFPIQVEGPPATFEPDSNLIRKGIYQFLSQNRYFSCLDNETLLYLANVVEIVSFARNETIFRKGEISDALGIVRNGEIILYYSNKAAKNEVELAYPDDLVGEIALLGRRANPSTAKASKDSEILKLTLDNLNPIIQKNPKFARRLNALVETRLMKAKERRVL